VVKYPKDWKPYIGGENDLRAIAAGYKLDLVKGFHAVEFIETFLRHSRGEEGGKPFKLLGWQINFIVRLFGWIRPDGRGGWKRRFTKAHLWIPKKNGKSTLCSAIMLYMLIADGEKGAEIYSAACDRSQAAITFNEAAEMVRQSPQLSKKLKIVASSKTIMNGTSSWMRALSADVPTKEGLNASCVVGDEIHAHKNRELIDTLRYSGRARYEPILIYISTAGDDIMGVGFEEYEEAKEVQSGKRIDLHTLAVVYEPGPNDNWKSEKTWAKCNPSLGHTIQLDTLREDFTRAQGSAQRIATFKRYTLNMWQRSSNPWIDIGAWDKCNLGPVDIEDAATPIFGGLDLASTRDTTALVLAWRDSAGIVQVQPRIYMPTDGIEEAEARDHVPYRLWHDDGIVRLTPGARTDYEFVKQDILDTAEKYDLQEIAFDPWMADPIAKALSDQHGIQMIAMRQGWATMSAPIKMFDRLVATKKLNHGGHAAMRWQVDSASVASDPSQNLRLVKDDGKSRKKIDAVVAAVMAVSRLNAWGDTGASVYDTRGLLTV
jgi:phage terminase large subunit-like protein